MCGANGPGCADEVEVVDFIPLRGKPYPPFGGKAPRSAAPVVQVDPVPAEGAQAGAGEHKNGGDQEPEQAFTPPQQHRALRATSVREERTHAKQKKTARKTAGPTSARAATDNVNKTPTDLFDESSSSSSDDEHLVVKASYLGGLHVQKVKDALIINELKDENRKLVDNDLIREGELQSLRAQCAIQSEVILGQPVPDKEIAIESLFLDVKHAQKQVANRGVRSKASLRQALIKVSSILNEHVAAVDRDLASLVSQITNELRPEGEGSPPPKHQKK